MDLVFIHGVAASGKLTTARELSARLGYPVFHNHLVVDLLTTVFPFGTEPFVRLREQMWLSVMTDAARAGTSLVFTFAPENTVEQGFPGRAKNAVESQGGRIRFVRLLVPETEQERRVALADRKEFHKVSDVAVLRQIRSFGAQAEQPPVDVEIDTGSSSAADTADRIIRQFGLKPQTPPQRYE